MLTQGEFVRELMARAVGGAEVGEAAVGDAVGALLARKERFEAAVSVGARAETRNMRAAKEIKMEQAQRAACDRGAQLVASCRSRWSQAQMRRTCGTQSCLASGTRMAMNSINNV